MLFNSLEFMLFFPIVTLCYFIIPHKLRYLWLLFASYYFYMCWNAQYALLMASSTFFTWLGGLVISKARTTKLKKAAVGINFVINLAILFFFKYFWFTVDNINAVLHYLNISPVKPGFNIILPVGISFYTFQALGYTVDVYRGEIEHEKNPLRYALFVSFFPQLVAGPIERSKNLLIQLKEKHTFNYDRVANGLVLMLWGYFLKLVIADRAAIVVDTVYNNIPSYFGIHFIIATFLFSIQIYCDFASYTTIARGCARVMGFELMDNFNVPYLSKSISEFWSRWHISLSTWFRDYLYIPLGGNRKGVLRKYINLMIVFITSGLWHGASWNFVIWGLLHGIFRVVGEAGKNTRKLLCSLADINRETRWYHAFQIIVTFILVMFAWIFFRADTLSNALFIVRKIFLDTRLWLITDNVFENIGLDTPNILLLFASITVLGFFDMLKISNISISSKLSDMHIVLRYSLILALLFAVLIFGIYGPGYNGSQFIYFQF